MSFALPASPMVWPQLVKAPIAFAPGERRSRAVEQARNLRHAVTAAVVRGHVAYADANARVSVLEAEIAALVAARRP